MADVVEYIRRLGLLDPTDPEVLQGRTLAPRLPELRGKVGGFLDNRKQNANILLERIAARLTAEYDLAEAVHRAKFIYSRIAEPAVIDELAERCDFVVAAIGD
ncbi:MAG TPA: hypothetical protein VNP04_01855 [Alphaproteobacteria bacterium]|nr:hypothetical protein [Alphaproteobacteria bacterium]